MNEELRFTKLERDVQRLKALLYSQLGGTTSGVASIDFAVDIFDKADADSLGTYWSPLNFAWNGFVIRSKRAVAAGGNDASVQTRNPFFVDPSGNSWTEAIHGTSSLPQGMVYQPKMTSGDFTIKVAFDGPPAPVLGSSFVNNPTLGTLTYQYDGVPCGFGSVAVSATSLGLGQGVGSFAYSGLWGSAYKTPAQFLGSIVPATAFYGSPLFGETGASQLLAASNPAGESSAPYADLVASSMGASNLLVVTFTGENVQAVLNGTTIMNRSSLLTATRSQAGILAGVSSSLFWTEAFGLAPFGITSFKAWRNDIPEPPDAQSGHGTYVAGKAVPWQYSDIYHTAVRDLAGNITGYTYTRT